MTQRRLHDLDVSRPVLVLDGAARADIGVVRSLGRFGIPVHMLTHRRSAVLRSRFVTAVHEYPSFAAADAERVDRLRTIATSLPQRPVTIATGDRALRFLSRTRDLWTDAMDHDLAGSLRR